MNGRAAVAAAAALLALALAAGAPGQEVVLSIDVDPTDGNGPCLPVTRTVTIEQLYRERHAVAVCLEGHPYPPSAFDITLLYDNRLNRGVEVPCTSPCVDGNPDANDGDGPAYLGYGWICTTEPDGGPVADGDAPGGDAHLLCHANPFFPNAQLSESPGLLAMVEFDVVASGEDRLRFSRADDTGLRPTTVDRYVCGETLLCRSGTIRKIAERPAPTPTVAPTFTPRATVTPTATRPVAEATDTPVPVTLAPEPALLLDEAGLCADGTDNDGDGLPDCEDPDCRDWPGCTRRPLLPWWAWSVVALAAVVAAITLVTARRGGG